MRTKKEIEKQIEEIKKAKTTTPARSAFGDDNHAAMDAQIEVLTKGMDADDVYAKWEDGDNYDKNRNLIHAAESAVEWLDGDDEAMD